MTFIAEYKMKLHSFFILEFFLSPNLSNKLSPPITKYFEIFIIFLKQIYVRPLLKRAPNFERTSGGFVPGTWQPYNQPSMVLGGVGWWLVVNGCREICLESAPTGAEPTNQQWFWGVRGDELKW